MKDKKSPKPSPKPTPEDVPVMERINKALVGQDLWLVGKDNLTPEARERRRRFLNLGKQHLPPRRKLKQKN
tara:strand:+ start:531 stop:743 length:213 start_codon:yes stop_codon:yes gene_type:complete